MTFITASSRIPTSIGTIVVHISEWPGDGNNPAVREVTYEVIVLDQNGIRIPVSGSSGDLVPHISAAQRQALLDFMTVLRAKAVAEFLP